jgi:uncharacterized protein involved in exopolysaccharide biosynthesis
MKEIQFRDFVDTVIERRRILILFVLVTLAFTFLLSKVFPPLYRAKITFFLPLNQTNIGFALPPSSAVTNPMMPLQSSDVMKCLREIMLSSSVKEKAQELAERNGTGLRLKGLKVDIGNTGIFTITSIHPRPKVVYNSVDIFYKAMTEEFQELASRNVLRIRDFLIDELEDIREKRDAAEENLLNYKMKYTIVSIEEETRHLVSKGDKLEMSIMNTEVNLQETMEKLSYLETELAELSIPISSESVGQNPVITNLRNNLAAARIDLARLKETFTEKHPDVIRKQVTIDELEKSIQDELEKIIRVKTESLSPIYDSLRKDFLYLQVAKTNAEARLESLEKQLNDTEEKLREQPKIQLELSQLQTEVSKYRKMENNLEGKLEEADLQVTKDLVVFEIIDDATLPSAPTYPDLKVNMIVAFILSLVGALIYCIILQFAQGRKKLKAADLVFLNRDEFENMTKDSNNG